LDLQQEGKGIKEFSVVNTVIFLTGTRLETVEGAQLNFRHLFWLNIVLVDRNFVKLAEYHPNWRRENQPLVEFRLNWTIFDQNRSRNSTARVRP
jgi:hypothetical protein